MIDVNKQITITMSHQPKCKSDHNKITSNPINNSDEHRMNLSIGQNIYYFKMVAISGSFNPKTPQNIHDLSMVNSMNLVIFHACLYFDTNFL